MLSLSKLMVDGPGLVAGLDAGKIKPVANGLHTGVALQPVLARSAKA